MHHIIVKENFENFGQKWGNPPIKKGNIEIFATSPQILVFNINILFEFFPFQKLKEFGENE